MLHGQKMTNTKHTIRGRRRKKQKQAREGRAGKRKGCLTKILFVYHQHHKNELTPQKNLACEQVRVVWDRDAEVPTPSLELHHRSCVQHHVLLVRVLDCPDDSFIHSTAGRSASQKNTKQGTAAKKDQAEKKMGHVREKRCNSFASRGFLSQETPAAQATRFACCILWHNFIRA